jgi:excisionase family DNA binding protein
MQKRKTRTTEITVEKSEIFVAWKATRLVYTWCGQCGAQVRMATPDEAALSTGLSVRTIYALVEAGRIHFTETVEELLLICLMSLSETMKDER